MDVFLKFGMTENIDEDIGRKLRYAALMLMTLGVVVALFQTVESCECS
jgi:hypothetical protein